MKAQMSLEMLAYLSLAGISILYCIATVSTYSVRMRGYIGTYEYSGFAQSISTAIMENASSEELYIPQGMCNSTLHGKILQTSYGNFTLPMDVFADKALLCTNGTVSATIAYANGTAIIGV